MMYNDNECRNNVYEASQARYPDVDFCCAFTGYGKRPIIGRKSGLLISGLSLAIVFHRIF